MATRPGRAPLTPLAASTRRVARYGDFFLTLPTFEKRPTRS